MKFSLVIAVLACSFALYASCEDAVGDDQDIINRLSSWVTSKGVDTSKLEIKNDYPRRGIFAKTDIAKGEEILKVTADHGVLIWLNEVQKQAPYDTLGPLSAYATIRDANWKYIAGHLQWPLAPWLFGEIARKNSDWKPYIDTLPTRFSIPAVVCSQDELTDLSELDPSFSEAILMNRAFLTKLHHALVQNFFSKHLDIFDEEKLTLNNFLIASSSVSTRSWVGLMIPFADMFNHRWDSNVQPEIYMDKSDASVHAWNLTSDRDIKQGDEVFITYGRKGSTSLWNTYGFVPDDMPITEDCIDLDFRSVTPSGMMNMFLSSGTISIAPSAQSFCMGPKLDDLYKALQQVRLRRMTRFQLDKGGNVAENAILHGRPMDVASEADAYRFIMGVLSIKMNEYTALDEKRELINNKYPESPCVQGWLVTMRRKMEIYSAINNMFLQLWNSFLLTGSIPFQDIVPGKQQEALERYNDRLRAAETEGIRKLMHLQFDDENEAESVESASGQVDKETNDQ